MKLSLPDIFNTKRVKALEGQVQELTKAVGSQEGRMKGYATEYSKFPGISTLRPDARLAYSVLNKCYKRSSAVRPAVDGIVREITTLPFTIDGYPGKKFDEGHKTEVEALLNDPNRNKETFREILAKALTDMLVYDAGAIEKVKSPSGKLVELMARAGDTMTPVGDEHGVLEKYVQNVNGTQQDLEKDELIYMMLYPRAGSLWGMPIIESIVDEVGTLLYSNEHIAKSFTEDEIPPGILNLGEIGKQAYLDAKEDFKVGKGQKKEFKLRVVHGTKEVAWIDFKRPNREMQLDELRKSIERIIFRNFGVVPIQLGEVSDVNRSHSADSEVLTKEGFKLIGTVKKGEEVGTLNPKTLDFEWQKNLRTYAYDFKNKMTHFIGKKVDIMVTPNHQMLYSQIDTRDHSWKPLKFADATKPYAYFGFVKAPNGWQGDKREKLVVLGVEDARTGKRGHSNEFDMKDWMKFLGYYLSEGNTYNRKNQIYRIELSQSDNVVLQKMLDLLDEMPYNVIRTIDPGGTHHLQMQNKSLYMWFKNAGLAVKASFKFIPTEFKNLSSDLLSILLDALMDGDGNWVEKHQYGVYTSSSKRLIDDVQEVVMKLGYFSRIRYFAPVGKTIVNGKEANFTKDCWRVEFSKSKNHPYHTLRKTKNVKDVDYDGKVYCLEVPNHILVTRRNGLLSYHGNSTALIQMQIAQSRLIMPVVNLISYYVDKEIIQDEFGFFDVRFVMHLRVFEDEDPESRAMDRLVRSGIKSINQVCAEKGWQPSAKGGDRRFVVVGKRLIFVDELDKMKSDEGTKAPKASNNGAAEPPKDSSDGHNRGREASISVGLERTT